ncbi:MAG TPA: hypothetical protein VK498_08105 [Ferruginibacter sp.]|nr:hypothetical protein [Ferruginibacter sp.]
MLVIAHHNISDPEKFWNTAKTVTSGMPSNLKLHSVYPSADGKTGTCLWEASTAEDVQKFLDKMTGDTAKNFCYEVNEREAVGIPTFAVDALHN